MSDNLNNGAPIFKEHDIAWDDSKVSRLWDYYSRTEPYSNMYFSKIFGRSILRNSKLPLDQPLNVLDFGCGPGFIWDHLNRLGACWQYTGVDFSLDSILKVTEKAKGHSHFKGAQHISSLPTNLPEKHFDAILLLEIVEHLTDAHLNSTLAEVARLLKRGGVVVISTPNEENLSKSKKFCPECGAIFHEWQHVRSWSCHALSEYFIKHGFALREAKTLDFAPQGMTIQSALKIMVKRIALRCLKGKRSSPHMIAMFQKI